MTKEQIRKGQSKIREEIRDQELAITEHETQIKRFELMVKEEDLAIAIIRNKVAVLMRNYEGLNLETPKKAKARK